MTSDYSISLIRDPARGTSQLIYLRVAWTSAFKHFFLLLLIIEIATGVLERMKLLISALSLYAKKFVCTVDCNPTNPFISVKRDLI